jgi:hypothetical protein
VSCERGADSAFSIRLTQLHARDSVLFSRSAGSRGVAALAVEALSARTQPAALTNSRDTLAARLPGAPGAHGLPNDADV